MIGSERNSVSITFNGQNASTFNYTVSQNIINMSHAKSTESVGYCTAGNSVMHEILESYYAGKHYPGMKYKDNKSLPFSASHEMAQKYTPVSQTVFLAKKSSYRKCLFWEASNFSIRNNYSNSSEKFI